MSSHAISTFISNWSIEVVPTENFSCAQLSGEAPVGTSVYVTSIPGQGTGNLLRTSKTLKQAGFDPVPHITARSIRSVDHLRSLLSSLEELDIQKILLLGGDTPDVAGPFASSLEVLESGILEGYSLKQIGFATYPERHKYISSEVLERQLSSKIKVASELGFQSSLVTQLCFDATATVRHIERLRARGIQIPVHVGVAGPTSWTTMLKFAAICGVAASAYSLKSNASRVRQLASGFDSTDQIADFAVFSFSNSMAGKMAPHFFTFGGTKKTIAWINALLRENSKFSEGVE